jgi:nucleoid-associated protein YgaU
VNIARSAYGSDKSWQRIYQANKSSISNPDVVPVGLVIKIPQ